MPTHPILFPFVDFWWIYAAFLVFVMFMLLLDLGIFHKEAHAVSFKEAGAWTCVWIALALTFNAGLYFFVEQNMAARVADLAAIGSTAHEVAKRLSLEFLAGYVIEKSLSVDNIFVFVFVFGYFKIPRKYQHNVLFYGVLGALIFRAIFIAIGSALMQYQWVLYIFGAFLIFTGIKLLFAPEKESDPEKNPVLRLTRKFIPSVSTLHGQKFFVKVNGKKHATPLFMCLVLLEMSDVIFAIDSVPAIFAITREPLIVFTSNIFAILGLRSMYFFLEKAVSIFRFLKYGLAVILIFVGLKMAWLNDAYDGHFPIGLSLGIIAGILVLSIVASLLIKEATEDDSGGPRKS